MSNVTSVTEFLLLEFSEVRELQIVHFSVFLAVYLIAVTGNLLIIIAVALDHHLHTPMYFFLMNLAVMDIGSISVIIPKSLANSLMNSRPISYSGCAAQVFLFAFFVGSDFALLTIMAHDRNVAICNPLRYEAIMNKRACVKMAVSAWMGGLLLGALHSGGTFSISFCSNIVNQFFCEVPQLFRLSCSNSYLIEVGIVVLASILGLGCFIFIIVTYVQIFSTVLRIPSAQGQKKALSTCLPHLMVVSLLMVSVFFDYTRPPSNSSTILDILCAVMYTIIPPLLNPFIYSMRNKDLKTALWKLLQAFCTVHSQR